MNVYQLISIYRFADRLIVGCFTIGSLLAVRDSYEGFSAEAGDFWEASQPFQPLAMIPLIFYTAQIGHEHGLIFSPI